MIGTTGPNSKLEVAGSVNSTLLSLSQSAVANNSLGDFISMDFKMSNEVSQYTGNPSGRISSVLERSGNGYGLAFTTRFSGAAGDIAERMRISSDGNVGIGTTTPGAKLDIAGNVLLSGAGATLTFNSGGPYFTVPSANTLTAGTSGVERLRIDSTGNVGIGTTSPGSTLDVKGTLRLSGATSGHVGYTSNNSRKCRPGLIN